MIVKNEEKYLEQCLDSVKDLADEIIIVDTGSTDKTKDIAKKFNAKIFDFKWTDDFSAARNESLNQATKDWILVLDADEILDTEAVKIIKNELIKNKENDAYLFIQKNYTDNTKISGFVNEEYKSSKKSYSGWYGSLIVRLFRNNKGYKFDGTVHELAEPSIESKKGKIAMTNIPIHHYVNSDFYSFKKKKQFYLELCKKKAKSSPDAGSYFELGVLYKENEDSENAIKSLKKAIELDPKHHMALYELGILHEQKKDYDKAIEYYRQSLGIKENSEVFQNLGICYFRKGLLKEAYRNLTKALLLNPNKYTIYNSLGAVLEKSGNFDNAIQMLEIGIKLNPKNSVGHYNLGVVFGKKGEFGKALENFEKALELGHPKKEEIEKRIAQLKLIIANSPNYKYSFGVGS